MNGEPERPPDDRELLRELTAAPVDLRRLAEHDPLAAELLGTLLAEEQVELVEILFDDD